jgi:RHS repeat-associated protein
VTPYVNNTSNELISIPGTTYTYDNNGNMATKTDATGVTTYTWDVENRLVAVALPGAGGSVAYKYDPFGRRVQKAFTQGSTTTTTNYIYDGPNLLEEVDNSGNVIARYSQSNLIDEPLSELRAGTTSYYEADGLGSITSLSNSAGTLANTYSYDSLGKSIASTGIITNPFQFTAREFDQGTGIYYYRMRYYDSSSGRFVSEDPAAFDLQWPSLYLYVKNRPTGLIDPFGLSPQVLGPFVCTWCAEFAQGSLWLWEGYQRMRQRMWIGDDKYYHCMANCRATNSGPGGAAAAKVISFFRTDVSSRIREPNDWRNDDRANKCGQQGGNCDQVCAPFVPQSSPGKPPFPGW